MNTLKSPMSSSLDKVETGRVASVLDRIEIP